MRQSYEELLIGYGTLSMESQLKLRIQFTVPLTDLNLGILGDYFALLEPS